MNSFFFQEKGLVIISTEQEEWNEYNDQSKNKLKRALVSVENAQLLQDAGEGCLGKHEYYSFCYLIYSTKPKILYENSHQ